MRKLLRTGEILAPRDADDAGKKRVGSEWWVVRSGRRRAAAGGRGRSFGIWAGTRATMGKSSAGVLEKESKKQRMVEIRGRTAIRLSERRRAEEARNEILMSLLRHTSDQLVQSRKQKL